MNVGKVQSVQINSVVFMLGVLGAHELFQINSHFCPVFCPLPLIFLPSNFAFSFALFHICPIFCPHFLPLPLPSTKKRARARAKNEGKIQGKCGRGQKRGQNQILLECQYFCRARQKRSNPRWSLIKTEKLRKSKGKVEKKERKKTGKHEGVEIQRESITQYRAPVSLHNSGLPFIRSIY